MFGKVMLHEAGMEQVVLCGGVHHHVARPPGHHTVHGARQHHSPLHTARTRLIPCRLYSVFLSLL